MRIEIDPLRETLGDRLWFEANGIDYAAYEDGTLVTAGGRIVEDGTEEAEAAWAAYEAEFGW